MNKVVKIIFVMVLFLMAHGLVYSQQVMWQRYYPYHPVDNAIVDVIQTFDGGYIMCGSISVPPIAKIHLIKINYLGILEWEKIIGDPLVHNGGRAIQQNCGQRLCNNWSEIFFLPYTQDR